MSEAGSHQVRMRQTVAGSREEVFRAWTDPEELKKWFGPGEFTIPTAELDLRPGGEYEIVMKPAEGDGMKLTGSYREIDPPSRLVFTWSWRHVWAEAPDSVVTVEFHEVPEGTEIVLTHGDFDSEDGGAPYRMGWEGGLAKLVRLFAGTASTPA